MAKGKTTIFYCQNCGHESAKWLGQCPGCKEWNTMVEEPVQKKSGGRRSADILQRTAEPVNLAAVDLTESVRMSTHIGELDRAKNEIHLLSTADYILENESKDFSFKS